MIEHIARWRRRRERDQFMLTIEPAVRQIVDEVARVTHPAARTATIAVLLDEAVQLWDVRTPERSIVAFLCHSANFAASECARLGLA